jgi:hypothetical protein
MTDYSMEAGSISQIVADRLVPIIHIATNLPIGYFTSEYLNTRARKGLVFFHDAKAWKILHITEEEIVFVLPSKNLDRIIHGNNLALNEAMGKAPENKEGATSLQGSPTPISGLITVESFRNYIIIHSVLGADINTTLRLAFDAMLTEQDLIRDGCNDDKELMIQTTGKLTREEIESVGSDLFHVSPNEFDRLLLEAIDARFPSILDNGNRQLKSRIKNTLREKLSTKLAVKDSKAILRLVSQGKIKIAIHYSSLRDSSQSNEFIDEYAKAAAAESDKLIKGNIIRFRRSIERENASLLCLNCLSTQDSIRISNLEDKPKCARCGSHLLALPAVSTQTIASLFRKKKSSKLNPAETAQLAAARRTADLVLSYGKRAIIALTIPGIGPQTASTILASMPTKDSDFHYDLLKARIHYITTRELWDRRQRPAIPLENRVRFNN